MSNKKAIFSYFPFQGLAGANIVLQCTQSKLFNTLTHKQTPTNNSHPRAPSCGHGKRGHTVVKKGSFIKNRSSFFLFYLKFVARDLQYMSFFVFLIVRGGCFIRDTWVPLDTRCRTSSQIRNPFPPCPAPKGCCYIT